MAMVATVRDGKAAINSWNGTDETLYRDGHFH
jgi:hypothetical protein